VNALRFLQGVRRWDAPERLLVLASNLRQATREAWADGTLVMLQHVFYPRAPATKKSLASSFRFNANVVWSRTAIFQTRFRDRKSARLHIVAAETQAAQDRQLFYSRRETTGFLNVLLESTAF